MVLKSRDQFACFLPGFKGYLRNFSGFKGYLHNFSSYHIIAIGHRDCGVLFDIIFPPLCHPSRLLTICCYRGMCTYSFPNIALFWFCLLLCFSLGLRFSLQMWFNLVKCYNNAIIASLFFVVFRQYALKKGQLLNVCNVAMGHLLLLIFI